MFGSDFVKDPFLFPQGPAPRGGQWFSPREIARTLQPVPPHLPGVQAG